MLSARYPTDLPAWRALQRHYREEMKTRQIAELFVRDRGRAENFSLQGAGLQLDYSKNLMSRTTRKLLLALAKQARVADAVDAMFSGRHVNNTEDRPALHAALRSKISDQVGLQTPDVREVWKVLDQMEQFVDAVNSGELKGYSGQRLSEIVNIGIGGSDLGPAMASRALKTYWRRGVNFHSVSNVDGTELADLAASISPERTLFVVCSKTFTTEETMSNARAARHWIATTLGEAAVKQHFAAASTNRAAMDAFGINPAFRFGFWDWVGGRYSIWSAIGLSLALVIGMQNFKDMLAGARRMDLHFRQAAPGENMPLLLALISVWYNNFYGSETQVILPYDKRLDRLPAYLQQLQMESNGKSVRRDGRAVKVKTGKIIWGEAGSNAQHSFYQLLHQGTRFVPADFILPLRSSGGSEDQHALAIAHCLAQSEALMDGYDAADSFLRHPGNRPSNTILFEALTPDTLGQLIALYEHKVFVESVIWGINPFDQYGVELGKKLAGRLGESRNPSTRQLLQKIRAVKSRGK